jgi:predicted permease
VVVAFGITGELAKEAILLCALPPAIMTTMFAAKYNVLKLESSSSTVSGTVVALFSRFSAGFAICSIHGR